MNTVPLCVPDISDEDIAAVAATLRSGWLAHGAKTTEFEEAFARFIGVKHAVSLNSCTSALFLALRALGIRGEVVLPSFTFVATANAVVTAGASPVFADVDEQTGNLDPSAVEAALTPRTEAIMPVHFAGQTADMDAFSQIVARKGLALIEDSAECIGGTWAGRQAGSFGVGCFSFFPTKNITTGEGGMLTTNDASLATRVRAIGAHGIPTHAADREHTARPWERDAVEAGFNFRMSAPQAALGLSQLSRLSGMNAARQALARKYGDRLDCERFRLPVPLAKAAHVYQMYTVTMPRGDRDGFVRTLRSEGIGASVHFDPPVHLQTAYRGAGLGRDLAMTERLSRSIVTLPLFPGMSDGQLATVAEAANRLARGFA